MRLPSLPTTPARVGLSSVPSGGKSAGKGAGESDGKSGGKSDGKPHAAASTGDAQDGRRFVEEMWEAVKIPKPLPNPPG